MQPATAQITNPTNMAKDQFGCLFFFFLSFLDADIMIQDLFTAPVPWNRLRLYKMLLYDPNNPFLTMHERILLFCSSFASLPLLLCLFFLCYAWARFKQEQDNVGEWCARMAPHCTALQYMMLMRLFSGISLLTYQRGRHSGSVCPARLGEKQEATSN